MTGRLLAAVAAFLLVGCGGPVAPTPSPTDEASTPQPTSAGQPTPTVAPTVAPTASPVPHPALPQELILRMARYGWPFPVAVIKPAAFNLYGDGRAIYTVDHGTSLERITFELRQAQLSADQVDDLLRDALGPGGLENARHRYDNPTVVDLDTTVFEIHAGGVDKAVSVYALGFIDEVTPDVDDRTKFQELVNRLSGFAADVSLGTYVDLGQFLPDFHDAWLAPLRQGQPNAPWPWPNLVPDDFEPQPDKTLEHVLSQEQVDAFLAVAVGQTVVCRAPDGVLYRIQIQPLLPDQLGNF